MKKDYNVKQKNRGIQVNLFNFADEFGPAKIIHIYESPAGQRFFQEGFEIQDAGDHPRKAERTAKNGRLGDERYSLIKTIKNRRQATYQPTRAICLPLFP